jgi:hypothetical protein
MCSLSPLVVLGTVSCPYIEAAFPLKSSLSLLALFHHWGIVKNFLAQLYSSRLFIATFQTVSICFNLEICLQIFLRWFNVQADLQHIDLNDYLVIEFMWNTQCGWNLNCLGKFKSRAPMKHCKVHRFEPLTIEHICRHSTSSSRCVLLKQVNQFPLPFYSLRILIKMWFSSFTEDSFKQKFKTFDKTVSWKIFF